FFAGVQDDVIARRFNVIDLVGLQKHNAFRRSDENPSTARAGCMDVINQARYLRRALAPAALFQLVARTLNRRFEPRLTEWLEQVIKGIYLKCTNRMLVVSRCEDHNRDLSRP